MWKDGTGSTEVVLTSTVPVVIGSKPTEITG